MHHESTKKQRTFQQKPWIIRLLKKYIKCNNQDNKKGLRSWKQSININEA